MRQSIFECQPGLFCRPTGAACNDDPYEYVGYDKREALHVFSQNGKRELFARRKYATPCWHLKRGMWCFEFVRSVVA